MRNRPQNAQAPAVVGFTGAAPYPPQGQVYGQQIGPYGQTYTPQTGQSSAYQSLVHPADAEDQPSDQFIFKKFGIPLLIAGAILAFLLVLVNAPRPSPTAPNSGSVASHSSDSPAPLARSGAGRSADYVSLPKINPAPDNFASQSSSSPAAPPPVYVRVDAAGGARYYSDSDLIGSWQIVRQGDGALLGTYSIDKVDSKLVGHNINWSEGPGPGDLASGSYDGEHWNLTGDKTNPDSLSYALIWADSGTFEGTCTGAKAAFKVTWHKIILQSSMRANHE